jgi:hypothetical protein
VHRAMPVVARAEAKQGVAMLKIMDVFLESTALQGQSIRASTSVARNSTHSERIPFRRRSHRRPGLGDDLLHSLAVIRLKRRF